jgi:hypothetical protein
VRARQRRAPANPPAPATRPGHGRPRPSLAARSIPPTPPGISRWPGQAGGRGNLRPSGTVPAGWPTRAGLSGLPGWFRFSGTASGWFRDRFWILFPRFPSDRPGCPCCSLAFVGRPVAGSRFRRPAGSRFRRPAGSRFRRPAGSRFRRPAGSGSGRRPGSGTGPVLVPVLGHRLSAERSANPAGPSRYPRPARKHGVPHRRRRDSCASRNVRGESRTLREEMRRKPARAEEREPARAGRSGTACLLLWREPGLASLFLLFRGELLQSSAAIGFLVFAYPGGRLREGTSDALPCQASQVNKLQLYLSGLGAGNFHGNSWFRAVRVP